MDATIYLIKDNGLVGFLTRHKETEGQLRKKLVDHKTADQLRMWRTRPEYLPGIMRTLRLQLTTKYKIQREPLWIRADSQKVLAIVDPIIRTFKIYDFTPYGSGPFEHISVEYKTNVLSNLTPSTIAKYIQDIYFAPDHPEYHSIDLVPNFEKVQVYQHHQWIVKSTKDFVHDLVHSIQFTLWRDQQQTGISVEAKLFELGNSRTQLHQDTYLAVFDMLRDLRIAKNTAAV